MAMYVGYVSTYKVGSETQFEFEVDDDKLAELVSAGDDQGVMSLVDAALIDAMWSMNMVTIYAEEL